MKSLFAIACVLALGAGIASAGCGVKDTHDGTLKSADVAKNTVVVVGEDGKEIQLTLTDKTRVTDGDGKDVDVSALVGKQVRVVSEHAKVESIQQLA
jgi:hypothetical protein